MPTELLRVQLLHNIRDVLTHARQHLQYAVNQTMVQAYWQVGRLIIEEEQQGQQRAGYGKQQLEQLSNQLQKEFGRGLMSVIYAICDCFIKPFQFRTQCVLN